LILHSPAAWAIQATTTTATTRIMLTIIHNQIFRGRSSKHILLQSTSHRCYGNALYTSDDNV
jgi:hypothetical protein